MTELVVVMAVVGGLSLVFFALGLLADLVLPAVTRPWRVKRAGSRDEDR